MNPWVILATAVGGDGIPAVWVTAGALIAVAIIGGIFAYFARRGGTKLAPAASYAEVWAEVSSVKNRLNAVEQSQRVMGDGFDAFYSANARSSTPLHFTPHEQQVINAARKLRTGEEELVG